MQIQKTEKDTLNAEDILGFIDNHESEAKPIFDKLWNYYKVQNETIVKKKAPDPNNPDNRTPVGYGRKIVNTFTGYAYRPRYITYKADDEQYMAQLQDTFNLNTEHLKTSRAGRNTGIYGVAYELMYIDGMVDKKLSLKAEPRFFPADPQEIILIYDYSPEPKKKMGIRYYQMTTNFYKVEVYYKDRVDTYDRKRDDEGKWRLTTTGTAPNFFKAVPIVPYYFGDDMIGIIQPVIPLIDDYDLLVSDGMNEFDRFAHAYLLLVKMSLGDPSKNKEPGAINRALQLIKKRRVFEQLPDKDAVSFLTKDIPTDFIQFMTTLIKGEIHSQSHIPDFSDKQDLAGIAVQRLMFDFENVVASAEADFDTGLYDRLSLINTIYAQTGRVVHPIYDVTISHKRNAPLNTKDFAETAKIMKETGFSSWLIADSMPDDLIPDVEEELKRQKEDFKAMVIPDIDNIPPPEVEDEPEL